MMTPFVEYNEMKIDTADAESKLLGRRVLCSGIVLGILAAVFFAVYVLSRVL